MNRNFNNGNHQQQFPSLHNQQHDLANQFKNMSLNDNQAQTSTNNNWYGMSPNNSNSQLSFRAALQKGHHQQGGPPPPSPAQIAPTNDNLVHSTAPHDESSSNFASGRFKSNSPVQNLPNASINTQATGLESREQFSTPIGTEKLGVLSSGSNSSAASQQGDGIKASGDSQISDTASSFSREEEYPAELHDIALLRKICLQVEHYLSDEYLSTDKYLLRQLRSKSEGYLSVKLLTSFKKIKKLTRNWRVTSAALKLSDKLVLSQDGCRVRRLDDLPENLRRCRTMTSVLCIRVPDNWANLETISELFSPFGHITLARILKPGKPIPTDLRNYATQIPDMGRTCCAVVEFSNCDSAHQSCRILRDRNLHGMRIALLGPRIRRTLYKPEKKKPGMPTQNNCGMQMNMMNLNNQAAQQLAAAMQAQQFNNGGNNNNQASQQFIRQILQNPQQWMNAAAALVQQQQNTQQPVQMQQQQQQHQQMGYNNQIQHQQMQQQEQYHQNQQYQQQQQFQQNQYQQQQMAQQGRHANEQFYQENAFGFGQAAAGFDEGNMFGKEQESVSQMGGNFMQSMNFEWANNNQGQQIQQQPQQTPQFQQVQPQQQQQQHQQQQMGFFNTAQALARKSSSSQDGSSSESGAVLMRQQQAQFLGALQSVVDNIIQSDPDDNATTTTATTNRKQSEIDASLDPNNPMNDWSSKPESGFNAQTALAGIFGSSSTASIWENGPSESVKNLWDGEASAASQSKPNLSRNGLASIW